MNAEHSPDIRRFTFGRFRFFMFLARVSIYDGLSNFFFPLARWLCACVCINVMTSHWNKRLQNNEPDSEWVCLYSKKKCVSAAVLGSAHVKRKIQIRKRLLSSGDSDVTLNCAEWSGVISLHPGPSCNSPPTSLADAAVSAKLKKALSDDFSFLKIFFMFVCGT